MPHSWDFAPPPPPPALPRPPTQTNTFKAFLGFGLIRPLRRERKKDFAADGGEHLIRSCVSQILGTQCANAAAGILQGELPWRSAFGSQLYRLRHKKGVVLEELARIYVLGAIVKWEPRVQVTHSKLNFDRDTRTMTIWIRYNVIDVNVPGNAVLLQGIEQTVNVQLAA